VSAASQEKPASTAEEPTTKGSPGGLWGGRFKEGMAEEMIPLNRSLGVDYRLWPHDIKGSQAWAEALVGAGALSPEEGRGLVEGLAAVGRRLREEDLSSAPDEDIHSLVERLLGEEVGALAGKLHTGRSRNDQVATDFCLWGRDTVGLLEEGLHELMEALAELAQASIEIILPGYTHLQQAQPIRGAHWVLSHFWAFERDRKRIREVRHSAGTLPLGAGALAGCPFPVDRGALKESLGFERVSENSLHAVADRDWAAELAFAGALLGVHLSRLGEDLVLFSSREFGYLALSEGYCTGSSLMPQKRNPDVAELVRGKSARLIGNLIGLLTLLKGLPSGYNRDLQEDKELLFDTADTLLMALPALSGAVRTARFQGGTIAKRLVPELLATDLADYLVRKGVPFRESHEVVGGAVRKAEDLGLPLSELSLAGFQEIHPAFDADVTEVFSFEASVEARSVAGGTSRSSVETQLAMARESLRN
jgi:argininosuccinate lyase